MTRLSMTRSPARPALTRPSWAGPPLSRRRAIGPGTALVLAAVVVAACAGSPAPSVATLAGSDATPAPGASATPAASLSPEDAMLAFAECMRDHGIDMPDPVIVGTGSAVGGVFQGSAGVDGSSEDPGPARPDPKEIEAASEACRQYLPGPAEGAPQLTTEQQDAMLAFAKCMRDHGIDMPDPVFGQGGGFSIQVGGGDGGPGTNASGGPDPFSPEFQAAQEACGEILADAMPGGAAPVTNGPGGAEPGRVPSGPGIVVTPGGPGSVPGSTPAP
jgi:hypothetical protein